MLSKNEAKKIGINACINKIDPTFFQKYKQNACASWGEYNEKMFCSIGIDSKPCILEKKPSKLILTEDGFQYMVSCEVNMTDGSIEYLECITPGTANLPTETQKKTAVY